MTEEQKQRIEERHVLHAGPTERRIMNDTKLYRVASIAEEYRDHKDVALNWFVHRRPEPSHPFTEVSSQGFRLPKGLAHSLVDLPDAHTAPEYWYSEGALNEMFTLEEAEKLAEYLRGSYGDEPEIHEEDLPIEGCRMGDGAIPVGGPQGFHMLSEMVGYRLPFEVWGYYDLRQHRPAHVELEIKLNNAATNDPCEVCGSRTDPEVGPELFLAGTWALVCHECAREHAPELVDCLAAYRNPRAAASPGGGFPSAHRGASRLDAAVVPRSDDIPF